jgi:hypothetical protein
MPAIAEAESAFTLKPDTPTGTWLLFVDLQIGRYKYWPVPSPFTLNYRLFIHPTAGIIKITTVNSYPTANWRWCRIEISNYHSAQHRKSINQLTQITLRTFCAIMADKIVKLP